MNARQVLIRAAKRIDSGKSSYCCLAIDSGWDSTLGERNAEDLFKELYSPWEQKNGAAKFWDKKATPERQAQRVLALLFAAEIAR